MTNLRQKPEDLDHLDGENHRNISKTLKTEHSTKQEGIRVQLTQ